MSTQTAGAEDIVRGLFAVRETFALPDGELEFQVGYDDGVKTKFAELRARLVPLGLRPELTGTPQEPVLTIRKAGGAPRGPGRLPVYAGLFTLAALVVSSLFQQEEYQALVPSWPYYYTFLAFGITVAAVLGAHELGQRMVARARDAGHATSYLIPGIPLVPPFLPSLGFATSQRDPALNRDRLFDTVLAGPLAMLALTVLLSAVGYLTEAQSAVSFASTNLGNTTVSFNSNAIQLGVGALLGPFVHPVAAGYVPVSPVADGAFVGFILVFLSLLPMASYDGGFLATIAWGQRGARAASYLSILALLALDTYTYWVVAIVVLVLVGRPYQPKLLDGISPLSRRRKWLLAGTIVLAFLCLPLPSNIATIPLP